MTAKRRMKLTHLISRRLNKSNLVSINTCTLHLLPPLGYSCSTQAMYLNYTDN